MNVIKRNKLIHDCSYDKECSKKGTSLLSSW